jgi:hypothetical protein
MSRLTTKLFDRGEVGRMLKDFTARCGKKGTVTGVSQSLRYLILYM